MLQIVTTDPKLPRLLLPLGEEPADAEAVAVLIENLRGIGYILSERAMRKAPESPEGRVVPLRRVRGAQW